MTKIFRVVMGVIIGAVFVVIFGTMILVCTWVSKIYGGSSPNGSPCMINKNSISIFYITESDFLISLLVTLKWLLSFQMNGVYNFSCNLKYKFSLAGIW